MAEIRQVLGSPPRREGRGSRPLSGCESGGLVEAMVGEHLNEATINWLRAFPNEANKCALDWVVGQDRL